jgi:hypothetical protein
MLQDARTNYKIQKISSFKKEKPVLPTSEARSMT